MISFKYFLNEAFDSQHIGHLTHFEDAGHESGHAGASHAIAALHAMHDHIVRGAHNSALTTKVDGGVAVITGHHPSTGKPFVAYKSAIGKIGTSEETGVCHSHDDIERHFKNKPYLKDKMRAVLDHAHKVLPKHGIFQGDVLHAGKEDEVKHENGKVSITPNTITYSAESSSAEGKKLAKSKLGISFHTKYHQDEHGQLYAKPVDHTDFKQHDDVYNLSTSIDTSRAHYSSEDQAKFKNHMADAEKIHKSGGHKMYDSIRPISAHISTYINKTVRDKSTPSTEGLKAHIQSHYQKEIDKLKTDAGKKRKQDAATSILNHIDDNAHHFDNNFKMHHHLTQAKNILVHTLNAADHPLEHHIGDKKSHPEGYVAYHNGKPLKAVDRSEFSAANFAKARD